ncbi:MAG TPA: creatininase family protein, partial [Pyrinomonadaceae bacterium]
MKRIFAIAIAILALQTFAATQTNAQKDFVSTREMDRINWMEFREVVPSKINTVLLPTGTLEPHGVINNGADNTAPFGMAKHISRRVNALVAPTLPYGITG